MPQSSVAQAAQPRKGPTVQQVTTVAAVMLGSYLSNFDARLTSVGLADLKGGFSLGFDDGAWFSSATIGAQIFVAPMVAWLYTAIGLRRIFAIPSLIFAVVCLAIPFTRHYPTLIALSIVYGMLIGVFVPTTIMVAFKNLPMSWWMPVVAIYAIRVGFAVDIGPSAVGFFVERLGWQWLYWQGIIVAPLMALMVYMGTPQTPLNKEVLRDADWGGMFLLGAGVAMIYAGLDQGNRLDWLHSGTVVSLLLGGAALFAGFLVDEALVSRPWARVNVLFAGNTGLALLGILLFVLSSLSNTALIPNFLASVGGLRPEQYGQVMLIYGALPMLVLLPFSVFVLRHVDPRWALLFGFSAFAVANLMGTQLTYAWALDDFAPIVLIQSVGQAFLLFPILIIALRSLDFAKVAAFVAYVQVARLGGAEIGVALITTWLRIREQIHSNYLGQHVASGYQSVSRILAELSAQFAAKGEGDAAARATASLASLVERESSVLAYIDGFWLTFWISIAGILFVAVLRQPPDVRFVPVPLRRWLTTWRTGALTDQRGARRKALRAGRPIGPRR
jgi:MFS transporter, DHA2 family, multidrug resistance protein